MSPVRSRCPPRAIASCPVASAGDPVADQLLQYRLAVADDRDVDVARRQAQLLGSVSMRAISAPAPKRLLDLGVGNVAGRVEIGRREMGRRQVRSYAIRAANAG